MMLDPTPRRATSYVLGFLLLLLLVLTIYIAQLLNSPILQEAVEKARTQSPRHLEVP